MAESFKALPDFQGAYVKNLMVQQRHSDDFKAGFVSLLPYISNASDSPSVDITIEMSTSSPDVIAYFVDTFGYRRQTLGNNTLGLHLVRNEFICCWCGAVNPITNMSCRKCGGSRGFILNR